MKKIMFLFIMVIGSMSSLSASDTGKLGIKVPVSIVGADCNVAVPNITAVATTVSGGNTIDWKKSEADLDEAIRQSALTTDKQLAHRLGKLPIMGEGGL